MRLAFVITAIGIISGLALLLNRNPSRDDTGTAIPAKARVIPPKGGEGAREKESVLQDLYQAAGSEAAGADKKKAARNFVATAKGKGCKDHEIRAFLISLAGSGDAEFCLLALQQFLAAEDYYSAQAQILKALESAQAGAGLKALEHLPSGEKLRRGLQSVLETQAADAAGIAAIRSIYGKFHDSNDPEIVNRCVEDWLLKQNLTGDAPNAALLELSNDPKMSPATRDKVALAVWQSSPKTAADALQVLAASDKYESELCSGIAADLKAGGLVDPRFMDQVIAGTTGATRLTLVRQILGDLDTLGLDAALKVADVARSGEGPQKWPLVDTLLEANSTRPVSEIQSIVSRFDSSERSVVINKQAEILKRCGRAGDAALLSGGQ